MIGSEHNGAFLGGSGKEENGQIKNAGDIVGDKTHPWAKLASLPIEWLGKV